MTKDKRQLRAEAVERLRNMDEWCDGVRTGADFVKALLWDLRARAVSSETVRDALVDLLTDDELTNGPASETNGIQTDSPLVDKLPEGDAVKLLREASGSDVSNLLLINTTSSYDAEEAYAKLADMVERDYVRREECEAWKKLAKQWEGMYDEVLTERNEWQRIAEDYQECKDALRAERDEYKEAFDFAESLERRVAERYVLDLWGVRYVPKEWYDEARKLETDQMSRVELREMIDSLKDELAVVAHERDLYRAKLGRVLDAVHEAEREAR